MRIRSLGGGRRWSVVGVVAAMAAGGVTVSAWGEGFEDSRVQLADGGAWLASPRRGLVTLINGPAEQTVGLVYAPAARRGDELSVVQSQASAYVVNQDQGTVARVDGATYEVSEPFQFAEGGSPLSVYAGGQALYVVDSQRRTASVVDPISLRVRDRLSLAAQPGPDQSVVDGQGRLWAIDQHRGGLTWFDDSGKRVSPGGAEAGARLVVVQGRPVIVDLDQARIGALSDAGEVEQWSCLDVRAGDQVRLLGSPTSDRVFATIPETGTLVAGTVGRDGCELSVPVGSAGDELGPPVQFGEFVFVPNLTSGEAMVVDVDAGEPVANLPVVDPGAQLELLTEDGFVFYNNRDGREAGVFKFEDGRWRVGQSLEKYDESDSGLLTPGDPDPDDPGDPDDPNDPDDPGDPDDPNDPGDPGDPDDPNDPSDPGGPDDPGDPGGPGDPGDPGGPGDPGDPGDPGAGEPVTLTVEVTGGGSVSAESPTPAGEPAGVECTAVCAWQYPTGTEVVLRAPNSVNGATFQTYEGCAQVSSVPGGRLCTLTVTAPAQVRVVFQPPPVPEKALLTATRSGQGTLTATPAGGSASQCDLTCSLEVDAGTLVTLTAEAFRGHQITGWDGVSGCATNRECTFAVDTDMPVTVTIEEVLEVFDLTVNLTGDGTVSNNGALVCADPQCTIEVREGTTLDLSAAGSSGHLFAGWDGACTGTGICQVTMDGDQSVTANFERPTLTVSVSDEGCDECTVTGPGDLVCSSTCEWTFDVNQVVSLGFTQEQGGQNGHRFVRWNGDCGPNTCTVTMDGNKSVTAVFRLMCGDVPC